MWGLLVLGKSTSRHRYLRCDLFGHCHRIVCVECRNSLNLLYCFFQEQVISLAVFTKAQRLNLSRHCASFRHICQGNCQAAIEIMRCWLNTCPKQCIIRTFGHWCCKCGRYSGNCLISRFFWKNSLFQGPLILLRCHGIYTP